MLSSHTSPTLGSPVGVGMSHPLALGRGAGVQHGVEHGHLVAVERADQVEPAPVLDQVPPLGVVTQVGEPGHVVAGHGVTSSPAAASIASHIWANRTGAARWSGSSTAHGSGAMSRS